MSGKNLGGSNAASSACGNKKPPRNDPRRHCKKI
jgi:hypothetical protein